MKNFLILSSFLLSAVITCCKAQTGSSDTTLDYFIKKTGDSLFIGQNVPGIFVGISDKGTRKYFNFGYADREKKTRFDSSTIFEIGSITKTFTAFVLEEVLKEKSISDTTSILPYLPDSVQANVALKYISFLNLLNHTSGLPRLATNMNLLSQQPYENYDDKKLFSFLKSCTPRAPGQYEYSNLAFGLAGVLATRISSTPYLTLVNERVFYPMGIRTKTTRLNPDNFSRGYFESEPREYWKFDAFAGAGALSCSASEMLTYFQRLSGPANTQVSSVVDKLLEPTFTIRKGRRVCRAWHTIEEDNSPVIYWHNGGTYGFSTFGAFNREKNVAVIVVVNQFNKNQVSDGLGASIIRKLMQ